MFRDWGAFREGSVDAPSRCFAIVAPPPSTAAGQSGAFASVATWPAKRIRAQFSARLSHTSRSGAKVSLTIGDRTFALTARGRSAWTDNRREDALLVSAMRFGSSMSIASVSENGQPFADVYRLHGAASAIDAAMLACPLKR